ncbi:ThiF family adenylyltransferase [Fibrobacter sp.]|uniref:tRNA threonylcarbamoyladenosine dehydratase n=1 Tax=Fibrobacter sp. TaxID=35828 RepID=UPI00388EB559
MLDRTLRIEALVGEAAMERLAGLRIAIFGVGGVGSVCAECLVRSGACNLTLVDSDCVAESNINRQLPAFVSTVGRPKVDVLAERFADINPDAKITAVKALYSMEDRSRFDFTQFDVVVDAIDSLAHKIDLLATAAEAGCKVFCSLGAAGKLDPTQVRTASIWQTKGCPLGKLVRNGLRKRGFAGDFMAVYSEEPSVAAATLVNADGSALEVHGNSRKAAILGSAMPVTAAFGLALGGLVIRYAMENGDSKS